MKAAVPFACLFLALSSLGQAGYPPALHVQGSQLLDPSGRVVLLRGVNRPGFVDSPDGFWDAPGSELYSGIGVWSPENVRAELEGIKKAGCNVVRFHSCLEWWRDDVKTFKDDWRNVLYPLPYREMVKETIKIAGEEGLYVIFDFYNLKRDSGQDSLPWAPFGRFPNLVPDRKAFLEDCLSLARELGPYSHVFLEPYNEPHGGAKEEAEWFAFLREALPKLNPLLQNPVVVQWDYGCWVNLDYPPPENDAATLGWIEKYPLSGNLVYSTHLYRNAGGEGNLGMVHRTLKGKLNCWETADIREGLDQFGFDKVAKVLQKPLFVGEVGAYLRLEAPEQERELTWFRNLLDVLNDKGLGYLGWTWSSDEQQEHGLLHQGRLNQAGQILSGALMETKKP